MQAVDDLPGWTFEVQEISANLYEVIALDQAGHRVHAKGTNLDHLLADARQAAKAISRAAPAER